MIFNVWLLSPGILFSRFTHVLACVSHTPIWLCISSWVIIRCIWYVIFNVWLLSPGLLFSRFTHVLACVNHIPIWLCISQLSDCPLYIAYSSSLVAPMVKRLPAVQEIQVLSLGWEGPLEKGMAPHSSTLAWRIPWTKEPCRICFDFLAFEKSASVNLCAHILIWAPVFSSVRSIPRSIIAW